MIDTNVVYSGLLNANRSPGRIVRYLFEDTFDAILSDDLERELHTVLSRPKFLRRHIWNQDDVDHFVESFRAIALRVQPTRQIHLLADESDNRLLEAASAANADYIVSGDDRVLALGNFEGTEIVSAARFVEIVEDAGR